MREERESALEVSTRGIDKPVTMPAACVSLQYTSVLNIALPTSIFGTSKNIGFSCRFIVVVLIFAASFDKAISIDTGPSA